MIPNQWYAILRSEDVRKDRPTGARRLGQELVIWRDTSGQLVCQSARCPHKGANLADGRLRGDTIGCPYHDFRFGADGECKLAPCLGPRARIPKSMRIDTYPVREQNGLVWMWWGRHMEVLPEIQVPPEVADKPALYATATWSQPVHYTRYIESLLDFYHVPIVHRDHWFNYADYMGWGGTFKKLGLDGRRRYIAMTKVENSVLETDGTTIRHAFDLCEEGDPTNRNFLNVTFTFPGMVHIHTAPFDVTIWMTPIDDENTQVMFRWYEDPHLQKVLRFKSLRLLIPRFALFAQKRVQEVQDMRVVTRVEPKISGRGVNKLVAVDELNAKYLVLRDKLKKDAEAEAETEAKSGASADPAVGRTPATNGSPDNGSGHSRGAAPAKHQVTTLE